VHITSSSCERLQLVAAAGQKDILLGIGGKAREQHSPTQRGLFMRGEYKTRVGVVGVIGAVGVVGVEMPPRKHLRSYAESYAESYGGSLSYHVDFMGVSGTSYDPYGPYK